MGGHPLRRLALTIGCLLLLLPLLLQLTQRPAAAVAAPVVESVPVSAQTLPVEITFAAPVQRFSVAYSGREIWKGEATQGTVQRALPIPFPKEGIDLKITAEWADRGTETAVRVTVTPPNQPAIAQTAWARGELDGVLTFVEDTP